MGQNGRLVAEYEITDSIGKVLLISSVSDCRR